MLSARQASLQGGTGLSRRGRRAQAQQTTLLGKPRHPYRLSGCLQGPTDTSATRETNAPLDSSRREALATSAPYRARLCRPDEEVPAPLTGAAPRRFLKPVLTPYLPHSLLPSGEPRPGRKPPPPPAAERRPPPRPAHAPRSPSPLPGDSDSPSPPAAAPAAGSSASSYPGGRRGPLLAASLSLRTSSLGAAACRRAAAPGAVRPCVPRAAPVARARLRQRGVPNGSGGSGRK